MRIDQQITLTAPIEDAWRFLMDLRDMSRCVPGVEAVEVVDSDTVRGTIKVKVGPIVLRLEGDVRMTRRDDEGHRATLEVRANDRRIGGGMSATTTLAVAAADERSSVLTVATDATLLGRLGQFGQPIIKRKAEEMARDFARNVAAELNGNGGARAT